MIAAPLSPAIAAAIESLRSARAAIDAHKGPEDIPDNLGDEEIQAVEPLALAPCSNVVELMAKLRQLLEFERLKTFGATFEISRDGSLAVALDSYFAREVPATAAPAEDLEELDIIDALRAEA